ncbi:quinone oxidoreductase [Dyella flava]|uniref:Quinone oxidoreductase n=1 Tax=Dyella flava TaxID=1920170 RepID=A0ABS2JYH3_9GAMM|nr:quinone oxidoreductase [Dyella flava]MBM7124050.1 quinone oxidoreductase [Dyella flava]GLQ52375.1 alcohol dehydrogenase [Dyella flava]
MKQVLVSHNGGPEQLAVTEGPSSQPSKGEVLVQVEAAGINYVDIAQREGLFELPKPYVPGVEGVGTITALGEGVAGLKRGDRIGWVDALGSYAEFATVPAARAIVLPRSFAIEQGLLLQAMTAQYLVHEYRDITAKDIALVHAAAGGVGQLLIQWLKHLGATVIATASSEEKLQIARDRGADEVINYRTTDFADRVHDITQGRGVDIAYDSVGKATLLGSVASLARGGTVVSFGASSGAPPAIEPHILMAKSVRLAGGALFAYIADPHELQRRAKIVIDALEAGWLKVAPASQYTLSDAARAHADLEGRAKHGKLVLIP